jgi:DNA-binding LacI/PurR family transcriptional regulator
MNTASPSSSPGSRHEVGIELRRRILHGIWQPGDRLPSEEQLSRDLEVSRTTLRRALDDLAERGLVERQHHRGCVVTARRMGSSILMGRSVVVISDMSDLPPGRSIVGLWAQAKAGVFEAVSRRGLNTVHVPNAAIEPGFEEQLVAERPLGIVLLAWEEMTEPMRRIGRRCLEADIPVVTYGHGKIGDTDWDGIGVDRVESDHESGTYQAVKWLAQRDHRRILRVWTQPSTSPVVQAHDRGYDAACDECDIDPLPPVWIDDMPDRDATDRAVFARRTRCLVGYLAPHLAGPEPIDAIMLITDCETFNAAAACRLLGHEPRQDVAIVGYDNYAASAEERRFEPSLPTLSVDKANHQLGVELAKLLEDRLDCMEPVGTPMVRRMPQQLVEVAAS